MRPAPRYMREADIGLPPNPDTERGRWEGAHDVLEQIGAAIAERRTRHDKAAAAAESSKSREERLARYNECECILQIIRAVRLQALS